MRGVLVGPAPGVFRNEFRNLASYLVVVLDLSDSKLSYQRAKVNLVEADYSVSIANVNLAEAIGTLGVLR